MTLDSLKAAAAAPEIFLAGAASAILLIGLFIKQENAPRISFWLSIGVLLLTALGIIFGFDSQAGLAFNGLFIDDALADVMKVAICLVSAGAFIYSRRYNQDRKLFKNEYYVLGLFSVCGMMIMASANNLLTIYLGLELMSLCMYAMIAFYRDNKLATEAAMKYFVLGALASSILLYGMSLLYGLTGSLALPEISNAVSSMDQTSPALALAVVFIVVAIAFKLGAVPFHMWVPDVYHGAPTSTTAFIGAAPKIAAFAMTLRLLIGGLGELHEMWQPMLIILALLSTVIGNIIAIAQDNLKRMLAYSTISHMGFFLFGILSATTAGYSAALYYVLVYTVMSLAGFGLILLLASQHDEANNISDLKGLSQRNPGLALLLLILMFSMAGIPPTAGFFAKFSVIQALVNAGQVWVAVVAVLSAVIGAFYYLRIIKIAYFDEPDTNEAIVVAQDGRLFFAFNVLIIIAILPWTDSLISLCNQVMSSFMG